jgi:molybdenum cofactor cytidylyltransferase
MIDPQNVAAILLAAGQSSRFGASDKLLADLQGQPLILHAAQRIGELNPARKIAVCGAEVGKLLSPLGFHIVTNPDARQGLSTSLACGIEAARQGECSAALVCLGDMPLISLNHLRLLLSRFEGKSAPIVGSRKDDKAMPPAIFARAFFDQLQSGHGDQGARGLLASADHITAPANELIDIDTIEDLRRVRP